MSIKVRKYSGRAYKPLVDFNDWRVAILNPSLDQLPNQRRWLEVHHETDEVFVLLSGKAWLISAGTGKEPERPFKVIRLKQGVIYQVSKNEWHGSLMLPKGRLLVVENRDTGKKNSGLYKINDEDRKQLARDAL